MADIPEGWQLVPTELTEDMAAAIELASGTEQLWLDVLSAAPAPPSPVPSSERDDIIEMCARIVEDEGPCRHVDHVQGFCACAEKAAAIRSLKSQSGGGST